MFSHSQNILTVLYRPQLFFLPQIPLSPPKVIQVQTASLIPYIKHLSHPVRRQDQHSMISYHVSGAAAGEQTPSQRGQFASRLQASVYQTDQTNAQTHTSPDSFLNNLH